MSLSLSLGELMLYSLTCSFGLLSSPNKLGTSNNVDAIVLPSASAGATSTPNPYAVLS